jgi:predicted Zn-dependent protease
MHSVVSSLIEKCISSSCAVAVAACIWVVIPFVFFLSVMPAMAIFISSKIPVSWEVHMGEYVLREINVMRGISKSEVTAQRQEHIQARFSRMKIHAGLPGAQLHFRGGSANAFALPGNTIIVLDGLVNRLNDEQVMAVIAHEFGHLHHRHVMQKLISWNAMRAGIEFYLGGQSSSAVQAGTLAAQAFVLSAYGRHNERQADAYAIALLKSSGENPVAFVQIMQFFLMLEKQHAKASGGWASTHPSTESRLNHAATETAGELISVTCSLGNSNQPQFVCK